MCRQILVIKVRYNKYHANPVNGSRVVSRGRTDGQTDRRILVTFYREHAKKLRYT
jgi:hypothetical protein